MHHALSTPNVGDPAVLVDLAVEAEASGWDAVFLWDHLHFLREARLDVVDPWVVLGAIARETERVRIGALVTPVARRRPWKLAKEITTLDHLSRGRVVVGVGLGEPPDDDFAAFGEPSDARTRGAILDEGVAVLDGLLRGEPCTYEGQHFHVDAELHPGCVQQPRAPIWVAGKAPNRRPRERAARYEGFVPISAEGGPITPHDLAEYAAPLLGRAGFDVVATAADGATPAEYADAGATWLVTSTFPFDDWVGRLRAHARSGPPA